MLGNTGRPKYLVTPTSHLLNHLFCFCYLEKADYPVRWLLQIPCIEPPRNLQPSCNLWTSGGGSSKVSCSSDKMCAIMRSIVGMFICRWWDLWMTGRAWHMNRKWHPTLSSTCKTLNTPLSSGLFSSWQCSQIQVHVKPHGIGGSLHPCHAESHSQRLEIHRFLGGNWLEIHRFLRQTWAKHVPVRSKNYRFW